MLDCGSLNSVTENPRINDITLDLLREYYQRYLSPFVYNYTIEEGSGDEVHQKNIELRFNPDNFCHLLGIETIVRMNVSRSDLKYYKGQLGWDNIKSGVLDFRSLKTMNKRGFLDQKSRFVFFYLIPKLLEAPKGVLFDRAKVFSNVDCNFLFYDEYQRAYIHVGVEMNEELGYFIPKTFLVEKVTPNNNGLKYVANQQRITVTKIDLHPPMLSLPENITVEATGPNGTEISFEATAQDNVDCSVPVAYSQAPGTLFPLGATTVTCIATDSAGKTAEDKFIITVIDTTPPVLALPDNITVEATSSEGIDVSFEATAQDIVDGWVQITYSQAPGTVFPLGTTTVTCTATDSAGNTAEDGFIITVIDTTPPVLASPDNIIVEATNSEGADV